MIIQGISFARRGIGRQYLTDDERLLVCWDARVPGLQGPISAHQSAVLQWVADGCPPKVMTGHSYKTTAVALQSRRLVVVTRKGGGWQARVTPAGLHYLAHGSYPPGHWRVERPRRTRSSRPAAPATDGTHAGTEIEISGAKAPGQEPARAAATAAGALSEHAADVPRRHLSAGLLEEVIAAGGVLPIDETRDRAEIERLVSWASGAPDLPAGQRLRRRHYWPSGVLEVYLEDDFWALTPEEPVPVPQQARAYHPVVAAYRADPDRHEVSRTHLARACRLLQALAAEAERRGHQVEYLTTAPDGSNGGSRNLRDLLRAGQVRFTISGHRYDLRIREKSAPGGKPAYTRTGRGHVPGWQAVRQKIFTSTGRLTISLDGGAGLDGRPGAFRDGATRRLEDRLPGVLREMQARALEAGHRQRERDQDAQRERIRQQEDEAVATAAFHEAHRAGVLTRQVQQWRSTLDLDSYLAALSGVVAEITDQQAQQEAQAWLDWARQHRDQTDPLRQPITMPTLPDPTAADLAPYLPRNLGSGYTRTLRRG